MVGPYVKVLRSPGAARFSGAGMLARLQMSMAGLGSIMLLQHERGSYALAGLVAAIYSLSAAVIGPQVSRQIDIRGQRKVVPVQLMVHLPVILAMVGVAVFTDLTWPLYPLAFLAGAAQPSIGPLVRTRWTALLSGRPELRTAFAWESLVDELVFIVGPPFATVLALQLFPSAAVLLASLFLTIGTVLLLRQTGTEPRPAGRTTGGHRRPAILLPGVAGLAVIYVLVGGVFGSIEVVTIAVAKQTGHPGAGGLLLAVYSFASLLGGLVFGALRLRASLLRQFVLSVIAVAVMTLPIPLVGNLTLVGTGLFLAGVACSPLLISATALLESIVPTARLTEAMSWSSSGMAVGLATATPLAGQVIDAVDAWAGYWVSAAGGVGALVVALLVLPTLRRARDAAAARTIAVRAEVPVPC